MTVGELIEALELLPRDLPVWHDGGGDPYCAGEVCRVLLDESHERWLGHDGPLPTLVLLS